MSGEITGSEAATLLGVATADDARRTLSRLGVKPTHRMPGQGGENVYDLTDVTEAAALRPGQGARKPKGLDLDNRNPLYLAGRLLRALERIQYDALPGKYLVADKTYPAAISNPNVAVIQTKARAATWIAAARRRGVDVERVAEHERRVAELLDLLDGVVLGQTVDHQFSLILGYHHQRKADHEAGDTDAYGMK